MRPQSPTYICYLLRLWCAGSEPEPSWRAALDNPNSGEHQVFADLEALFAFLEEKIRGSAPTPYLPPRPPGQDPEEAYKP